MRGDRRSSGPSSVLAVVALASLSAVTAARMPEGSPAPLPPQSPPAISSLNPSSTTLAYAGTSVTVNGSGFSAQSVVRFDSNVLPTTFQSAFQLTASVDPPFSTTAGTYLVTVFNPATGTSNGVVYTVLNPIPTINSICPCGFSQVAQNLLAGQGSQALTIDGAIFASNATVRLNGNVVPSTWVDRFTINFTMPASYLASPGSVSVSVFNPAPGGGTSNAFVLPVHPPVITSASGPALPIPIAPTTTATVFLFGTHFDGNSVIYLDGVPQNTIHFDSTQVRFSLPHTLPQLQVRGAIVVNVVNFGNIVSNSLAIPVGTAANQGTIRRDPLSPAPGTPYSLLLENGAPGQPFTLIGDLSNPAILYPFPTPAANFVLGVFPYPPGNNLWFPLADGIGLYGPSTGHVFDVNGKGVGFSLTLPNPTIGFAAKVQAVFASPTAPLGFYIGWARTEPL